jgi:hypothetical protein
VIKNLGIMEALSDYHPILCGTLPIGIDIEGSDLDIIMDVSDFNRFENRVNILFGEREDFKLKRVMIRNIPVIKANFQFQGFEFELSVSGNLPINSMLICI